jgi:hypothetical protein
MSDYSSQPLEVFEDTSLRRKDPYKFKRLTAGRPPYEESMAGIKEKVQALSDNGHQFSVTAHVTNTLGRGKEWGDTWEVGNVDPKSFATLINSCQPHVHVVFEKKANSYDFDFKRLRKLADESERKASELTRQRENFENLSGVFGSSSVRHVI